MFKPTRTVTPKTIGLGTMRFARKITERVAALGSYELSESELIFAVSAARENDDLLTALELLNKVLELIKRGFDRRVNAVILRIINNVGIMLGKGGFSSEYFNAVSVFNKISSAVYEKNEDFDISECRGEIGKLLSALRPNQTGQIKHNGIGARALRLHKAASERKAVTVNTLNSGLLRITARNPELMKMLKLDKSFMELSLKNIERVRRRSERALAAERFVNSLTAEQIRTLEAFVISENLFSEFREKSSAYDLKYLLENSSEKSCTEFFEALRQRIEKIELRDAAPAERSFFNSEEEMKEFFVAARRVDVERLIKALEKDGVYGSEVKTLTEALRIFTERAAKTEERGIKTIKNERETLTEVIRDSETALEHIKQRLGDESFSFERFINSLGASGELKKLFAEYAWENYRSEETLSRYSRYIGNTVSADKSFDSEQAGFHIDSGITSKSTEAHIDDTTMMSFAEFLISSGELSLLFSEGVKNKFLSASSDVVSAFAEYLVNSVREDSSEFYGEQIRSIAEKAEQILYYGNPNPEERCAETFSVISGMWNENALQLSELFASFTQSRIGSEEILGLYLYLPKTNFKAVSEFFEAAAQGNKYFIDISKSFSELEKQQSVLNDTELFEGKEISTEGDNTFYDVLRDMSENTLTLLLPLAGAAREPEGKNTSIDNSDSIVRVDRTSVFVFTALFAEYLSDTLRGDTSERYNERLHTLAERLGEILHDERLNINEGIREILPAESIDLIYGEWNYDRAQISELYKGFTESFANREDILRLYSRLPQSDFAEITNSAEKLFGLNSVFSKRPEKLFEQMKELKNALIANSDNGEAFENTSELVFSIADTHHSLSDAPSGLKGFTTAELSGILAELTSLSSVLNRTERRIYNIAQSQNKKIVTNKAFYNAFAVLFGGDASENITDGILSESFNSALDLMPRDYFFTWENGNVTLFNRAATDKIRSENHEFFENRSSAVLMLANKISEKFAAENQSFSGGTVTELFYTDKYFERSVGEITGGTAVNYAVPAGASSGGSDDISEKLGTIRSAIDSINTEITDIRRREEELSQEFVTKSGQKEFEKEFKSSIERDIFLAGKRRGIY